uniref:Uncharacterized protein n=1 Tax=Oryza barthii TaxID=65489 RepID=A0A0D3GIR5_9ORYZ
MGQRRRAPWLRLLFLAAGALLLRLALAEEELQAATSAVATPNGGVEECEDEVVLKKGENAVRGDVDDVKRHTSLRGWGVWSGGGGGGGDGDGDAGGRGGKGRGRGRGRGIGGGIGRGNGQNGDRGINSGGRGKIKGSNGGNRNVIGDGNKGGGGDGGSDNAQSGDGGGGWESSGGGGGRGDVSGAGGGGGGGGGDEANGVRQFIVPGPSICSSHRCKHGGDGTGNGQRKITTTGGNHGSSGVTKPKGEP